MLYRHDIGLYYHSSRVAELALQIGEQLKLSKGELKNIVKAALLHDIGKTRIPRNILDTPGPLSEAQWIKVRMHPMRIVSDFSSSKIEQSRGSKIYIYITGRLGLPAFITKI